MMRLPLRRNSPRGILLLPLAVLLLYACTDQELPTSAVRSPEVGSVFEIRDGANGGNKHFFFLPPLVKQPTYSGTPDGTLSPEVLVCDLGTSKPTASSQCAGWPAVAQFNRTTGTASEVIRYDDAGGHYVVNWHTDRCVWGACTLKTSNYYRIEIRVAGVLLGLADVDPVKSASDLRNYTTGDAIPLVNGRTLPLKFRIERGAISVLAPGQAAPITSNGGTVATEGGTVALAIPEGALSGSEPTPITVAPVTAPSEAIPGPVFDGAIPGTVFDFGPDGTQFLTPITLSIRYDPAKLPLGVSESRLRLYLRTGRVWQLIPGSGVDPLTKTVTGQVHHFSEYAILPVAASLTVTPESQTLAAKDTVRLDAAVQDSAGNRLNDRLVVWASSDMLVAVVDPTGLVTAVAPGSATITATSDGHSDAAMVTVVSSSGTFSVASIEVSPSSATQIVGAAQPFTVTLRDSGGSVLSGREVSWSSSNAAVATVDQDGQVTVHGIGTSTITATSEGVSGTATITGEELLPETITAGTGHTCGLTPAGKAYCWGFSWYGQLGDGIFRQIGMVDWVPTPVAVLGGHTFKQISAGAEYTLGITTSGAALAWGDNSFGALGDGTGLNEQGDGDPDYVRSTPVAVVGGHTFVQVNAGAHANVGITTSGTVLYWGVTYTSDGSNDRINAPVPVLLEESGGA